MNRDNKETSNTNQHNYEGLYGNKTVKHQKLDDNNSKHISQETGSQNIESPFAEDNAAISEDANQSQDIVSKQDEGT